MSSDALTHEDVLAVDPSIVEARLAEDGWMPTSLDLPATVWTYPDAVQPTRLLIPHDRSFDDYLPRLREALEGLREIYDDEWPAILLRAQSPRSDVFRFRSEIDTTANGSISLEAGYELFEGVKLALGAAVRSVAAGADKAPSYGRRGWKQVDEYLSSARLGQTERGSYVVTVISRLSQESTDVVVDESFPDIPPPEPFERKVNVALVRALEATRLAADSYVETSNFGVFEEAVLQGVSAELCGAVVRMIESGHALSVSVEATEAVAWPSFVPTASRFEASAISPISTASARLREGKAIPNTGIIGSVVALSRKTDDAPGVVTIRVDDGVPAKTIKVRLLGSDYHQAITAHDAKLRFSVRGRVIKEGRKTWLYDASDVVAYPPDPDFLTELRERDLSELRGQGPPIGSREPPKQLGP